jgi:heme ABC exporter ATP-binding subunit CcmA
MIIQAKSLARRFQRRWAYAHINLELVAGERLLLIGANGSGKTTLLRSFATLLPPSKGELLLFGKSVQHPTEIRKRIGFVSHHSGLYTDLSALENLQVYASLMGLRFTRAELEHMLDSVGLEIRTEPIHTYSAGMKKRASIALLLLKKPELILLDEPFSALDPKGVEELSSLFLSLGSTLVIASHQVESAANICTRAILLEDGLTRWEGDSCDAWKAWRAAQRQSL